MVTISRETTSKGVKDLEAASSRGQEVCVESADSARESRESKRSAQRALAREGLEGELDSPITRQDPGTMLMHRPLASADMTWSSY